MNDIIVAAIAAAGGLAGSFIGLLSSRKLLEYKIEELTKKVEKHNNIIERTYKLEEHEALQDEKIKVANHRIEDLERTCGE